MEKLLVWTLDTLANSPVIQILTLFIASFYSMNTLQYDTSMTL